MCPALCALPELEWMCQRRSREGRRIVMKSIGNWQVPNTFRVPEAQYATAPNRQLQAKAMRRYVEDDMFLEVFSCNHFHNNYCWGGELPQELLPDVDAWEGVSDKTACNYPRYFQCLRGMLEAAMKQIEGTCGPRLARSSSQITLAPRKAHRLRYPRLSRSASATATSQALGGSTSSRVSPREERASWIVAHAFSVLASQRFTGITRVSMREQLDGATRDVSVLAGHLDDYFQNAKVCESTSFAAQEDFVVLVARG